MRKVYQPPTLKVVEFKVERGFLGSNLMGPNNTEAFFDNTNWDEVPTTTMNMETFGNTDWDNAF